MNDTYQYLSIFLLLAKNKQCDYNPFTNRRKVKMIIKISSVVFLKKGKKVSKTRFFRRAVHFT